MTDTNPSGASLAPVADSKAPAASAETPAGTFGSTRGSGLARGKRQSSAAAPTANTAKSDYKPIALEVITPASEYKNPFASPVPEDAPAAEPAKVETPAAPVAAAVQPELIAAAEAPVAPEAVTEKREINILPPAESIRPAFNWESPSAAQNANPSPEKGERALVDERPTFRPDRREDYVDNPRPEGGPAIFDGRDSGNGSFQRRPRDLREARQPRDPRDARQPRDPREARQPRDPRDARQPRDPRFDRQPRDPRDEQPRYEQRPQGTQNGAAAQAAPESSGFFGWLKSLFGGSKPVETPPEREFGGDRPADGQRPRRRHRGGRGHGGNYQGIRGERPFQGGPRPDGQQVGEGENRGGGRYDGPRRRRNRGGPGRGGEPRAEGHQGGGAI
jgi:hypothetical protein